MKIQREIWRKAPQGRSTGVANSEEERASINMFVVFLRNRDSVHQTKPVRLVAVFTFNTNAHAINTIYGNPVISLSSPGAIYTPQRNPSHGVPPRRHYIPFEPRRLGLVGFRIPQLP